MAVVKVDQLNGGAMNMMDWFTDQFETATITPSDDTAFNATFASGVQYDITGENFVYGVDDFPTDGTIENIVLTIPGAGTFSISGLSISVDDFNDAMSAHDWFTAGQVLLNSDDTITGSARDDVLFGFGGNDIIRGGAGNNLINGGDGDDKIYMGSGNNSVVGDDGDDLVIADFFGAFTVDDLIDGGDDFDRVNLVSDHSAGLTITGAMMINVEYLRVDGPYNQHIVLGDDGVVAAGESLVVDAFGSSTQGLRFNGSAETDGDLGVYGTNFNDTIITGRGDDYLDGADGGVDKLFGGQGDDLFYLSDAFDPKDRINGGGGFDVMVLDGDYSTNVQLGDNSFQGIDYVSLQSGFFTHSVDFSYNFTLADGNTAAGMVLEIDGLDLSPFESLVIDAHREMDGYVDFLGGAGDDVLIGARLGSGFLGQLGADRMVANEGEDFFTYFTPDESTSAGFDTIEHLDGAMDAISIGYDLAGVNARITHGALTTADFDGDMEAAIGAGQLGIDHAVLFKPDSGDYVGTGWFLVIDYNGEAGYQGGEDFVIRLTSSSNLGNPMTYVSDCGCS